MVTNGYHKSNPIMVHGLKPSATPPGAGAGEPVRQREPFVSVVIVTYNVSDLVIRCLQSVFASKVSFGVDVIVVDAGTDGSGDRIRAEYPAVTVIQAPENPGFGTASNLGLRRSHGNYLLLLNPDTVIPPDALALAVADLEANPGHGIVGPKLVRADGSLDLSARRSFPTPRIALYHFLGLPRRFPKVREFGAYNLTYLNPDALRIVTAKLEPLLARGAPGDRFQFEREGFYCADPDSRPGAPVYNRTVGLKDSWAKHLQTQARAPADQRAEPSGVRKRVEPPQSDPGRPPESRVRSTTGTAAFDRYVLLGLSGPDAAVLADDPALAGLFEEALKVFPDAKSVANLVINDVAALRKAGEFKAPGREIGRVAELVDAGDITSRTARNLLAVLATEGGEAGAIVKARAWNAVHDRGPIEEHARNVLAAHPNEVAAYCAGKAALLGFFVGKVMKAMGGKAQPQIVQEIVLGMLAH